MARAKLFDEDLAENSTKRVAVAICIDTSGSMGGAKAEQLVSAITSFYRDVDEDPAAHAAAEICVVNFNDGASVIQPFAGIEKVQRHVRLSPGGYTNTGAGVSLALDTLRERKEMYTRHGVRYVQPWLVLMSDGATYPATHFQARDEAIRRVVGMVDAGKLTVIPVAIGSDADLNEMARFSPEIPPLSRQPLDFREFFKWLSASLSRASQDHPGAGPDIDLDFIVKHVDATELKRQVGQADPGAQADLGKYKRKYGGMF